MNFTKTMLALAMGSVGIMGAMSAKAVNLNPGDILTLDTGTGGNYGPNPTGSWFGMDTNGDGIIQNLEVINMSQGTTGITIGQAIAGGPYHTGAPTATDIGPIVKSWFFNPHTGTNYVSNATGVTGGTGGLDMSGWGMSWSIFAAIPLGTGAWTLKPPKNTAGGVTDFNNTGISNGVASFSWDGVYGHAYSASYTATVPAGDPSGFGGIHYALRMTGLVIPVPEASTYGMMLAGLGLIGGMVARRRKL